MKGLNNKMNQHKRKP